MSREHLSAALMVLPMITLAIVVALFFRTLNSMATRVTLRDMGDHICALAVTTDGVAIDCWEKKP